jgi:hypothetical protein
LLALAPDAGAFAALGGQDVRVAGIGVAPAQVVLQVGAMSVPSVRTVVVFPAPFGPRKPNTSPWPISKETSSNATRSPKRLPRPRTEIAGALRFASDAAAGTEVTKPEVAKRSPRAWTAGSSWPGTAAGGSAGGVVRRLSFLLSHLIR